MYCTLEKNNAFSICILCTLMIQIMSLYTLTILRTWYEKSIQWGRACLSEQCLANINLLEPTTHYIVNSQFLAQEGVVCWHMYPKVHRFCPNPCLWRAYLIATHIRRLDSQRRVHRPRALHSFDAIKHASHAKELNSFRLMQMKIRVPSPQQLWMCIVLEATINTILTQNHRCLPHLKS